MTKRKLKAKAPMKKKAARAKAPPEEPLIYTVGEPSEVFGKKVRIRLEELGLRPLPFAKAERIDEVPMSECYMGGILPSEENLKKLANGLGLSPKTLLAKKLIIKYS